MDVDKLECFCTIGRNGKTVCLLWKTVRKFLQKLKIELPYDPEGIHPKELEEGFLKEFASMFLVALFTIAGASQVALVVKEPACQGRRQKRQGFNPWIRKIPWRRAWQHSSILTWRIPWTEGPGELQSIGSQRDTTEATWQQHSQQLKCGSNPNVNQRMNGFDVKQDPMRFL